MTEEDGGGGTRGWRRARQRVEYLETARRLGLGQVDPVERRAELERQKAATIATWWANNQTADELGDGAQQAPGYYGANPESKNWEAQMGRGTAPVLNALLPMRAGPAAALTQMGLEVYGRAYHQRAQELRALGVRDAGAIYRDARATALREVLKEGPKMLVYTVLGKAAAGGSARLRPASAGPVSKGAMGAAGATASNIGAGSLLRAIEGQDWRPTIETLTSDALFGIVHGRTVWRDANAEFKSGAAAELARRDQIAQQASPHDRQNAYVAAITALPEAERRLAPRAAAKREAGQSLTPEELRVLQKVDRDTGEALASKRAKDATRASGELHDELPYKTKYYDTVGREGENVADILDKLRRKGFIVKEDIGNTYDPETNTITYTPSSKRWQPLEEFLHGRVKEGFKAKEIASMKEQLNRPRKTLGGKWIKIKDRDRAAEEIVVKQTLLDTLWGLSPAEQEYLKSQIDQIRRNGPERY